MVIRDQSPKVAAEMTGDMKTANSPRKGGPFLRGHVPAFGRSVQYDHEICALCNGESDQGGDEASRWPKEMANDGKKEVKSSR